MPRRLPRRKTEARGRRTSGSRALWSGSISFGLLQIPIGLHPAEQRGEEIHFRLLDRHDLSPIRNVRVNHVREMIQRKVRTGRVRAAHVPRKAAAPSNAVDLVAILQKSLRARGRADASRSRSRKAA